MSDRFPAEISIGGTIPRNLLPALFCALNNQCVTYEYDSCITFKEESDIIYDIDGHLTVSDPDARNGEFNDLEDFLIEHKIPFDRFSSSYYEFPAERTYYRPESAEFTIFTECVTEYGEQYVLESDVQEFVARLEKVRSDSVLDYIKLTKAIKEFKQIHLRKIPVLPKFTIVDK